LSDINIRRLCEGISPAVIEEWYRFIKEYNLPNEQASFHIEKALLAYMEQYKHAAGLNRVYGDMGSPNISTERLISPLSENGERPCNNLSESILSTWEHFLLEYGEPNNTYHTEKALMTYIASYRRRVSKKIELSVFKDSEE